MPLASLLAACALSAHPAAGAVPIYRAFFPSGESAGARGTASDFVRVYANITFYQALFPFYVDAATNELVVRSSITDLLGHPSRDYLRSWQTLGLYPRQLMPAAGSSATHWHRLCAAACYAHNASYTFSMELQLQTLPAAQFNGPGTRVYTLVALDADFENLLGAAASFASGIEPADVDQAADNGVPSVSAYVASNTTTCASFVCCGQPLLCNQFNLTNTTNLARDANLTMEWIKVSAAVRGTSNGTVVYTYTVWRSGGAELIFNETFAADVAAYATDPAALGLGFGLGRGHARIRRFEVTSDAVDGFVVDTDAPSPAPTPAPAASPTPAASLSNTTTGTATPQPVDTPRGEVRGDAAVDPLALAAAVASACTCCLLLVLLSRPACAERRSRTWRTMTRKRQSRNVAPPSTELGDRVPGRSRSTSRSHASANRTRYSAQQVALDAARARDLGHDADETESLTASLETVSLGAPPAPRQARDYAMASDLVNAGRAIYHHPPPPGALRAHYDDARSHMDGTASSSVSSGETAQLEIHRGVAAPFRGGHQPESVYSTMELAAQTVRHV